MTLEAGQGATVDVFDRKVHPVITRQQVRREADRWQFVAEGADADGRLGQTGGPAALRGCKADGAGQFVVGVEKLQVEDCRLGGAGLGQQADGQRDGVVDYSVFGQGLVIERDVNRIHVGQFGLGI
ncbi:MAG: hypothetical protein A2Y32_11370 [Spirochaetes bacterium GWF1_60_12]|nr:MAG: hypothetical protein A2Y32_11370 [Spirochaetes bacterium GWF1_60_12]